MVQGLVALEVSHSWPLVKGLASLAQGCEKRIFHEFEKRTITIAQFKLLPVVPRLWGYFCNIVKH